MTSPTPQQQYVDFLTALGQQVRVAYTALTAANDLAAETNIRNPFFDGILNEKLNMALDCVKGALHLIADDLQLAIQHNTTAMIDRLVVEAQQASEAVHDGRAFGFTPSAEPENDQFLADEDDQFLDDPNDNTPGCAACPADCASRLSPFTSRPLATE